MQDVNRKKIMHWNVATYGLPGSAMIVLHADRWPNGCLTTLNITAEWTLACRNFISPTIHINLKLSGMWI